MPNIEEKFPEEYSYALATADYYEARFLIDSKKYVGEICDIPFL